MFSKSHILIAGLLLLAVFAVAVGLIGRKTETTANQTYSRMNRETGRYRAELIRRDFQQTEALWKDIYDLLNEHDYTPEGFSSLLLHLVHLDQKLSRIWFVREKDGKVFCINTSSRHEPGESEKESWRQWRKEKQFALEGSGLYESGKNRYWTHWGYCRGIVFGLDVSLADLHAYFASMSMPVRSYAFIINEAGILVAHPDEQRVGTRFTEEDGGGLLAKAFAGKKDIGGEIFSDYLSVPVERIYYPIPVGLEKWVVAVNVPTLIYQEERESFHRYILFTALIMVTLFGVLLVFSQRQWRKEYELRRKIERETAELTLLQLRNQVNPHFLFNSLHSLNSLISCDPALAKEFVLKLSKVYRYVLEKRNESLAPVKEELEVTRTYYFLQKVRFEGQLLLEIEPGTGETTGKIPVMSLQMLMENAIKHNEITRRHPLRIRIFQTKEQIIMQNTYHPRSDVQEASWGIGFGNIRQIYSLCSNKQFSYYIAEDEFICILPFIFE